MSSKVDIVNQALMMLGASPIISFDDESTEANAVRILYDPAKRQLLRSFDWNCACITAQPALLTDPPVDPNYVAAFSVPSDSLRIIEIFEMGSPQYRRVEWEIQGNKLLTRTQKVLIRYVSNIAEPNLDSHVEMALVARMAMDLAYAITADSGREGQMAQIFQQKLNEAMITDAQERSHKNIRIDQFEWVRI